MWGAGSLLALQKIVYLLLILLSDIKVKQWRVSGAVLAHLWCWYCFGWERSQKRAVVPPSILNRRSAMLMLVSARQQSQRCYVTMQNCYYSEFIANAFTPQRLHVFCVMLHTCKVIFIRETWNYTYILSWQQQSSRLLWCCFVDEMQHHNHWGCGGCFITALQTKMPHKSIAKTCKLWPSLLLEAALMLLYFCEWNAASEQL